MKPLRSIPGHVLYVIGLYYNYYTVGWDRSRDHFSVRRLNRFKWN